MTMRRSQAPGRVTLIGDHTDYAAGRSLPLAINLGTTVTMVSDRSGSLHARSSKTGESLTLALPVKEVRAKPGSLESLLEGLLTELPDDLDLAGGSLEISSNLPLGAGLSSSASLLISVALALGIDEDPVSLARRCQLAEAAAGQSVGLLDQLAIIEGRAHHCLLIDFATTSYERISVPPDLGILVVHSGIARSLADSSYAERRSQCEAAAAIIGPLGLASRSDLERLEDPVTRARARHVISESARVDAAARALIDGDLHVVGELMNESHCSLRDDFAVSLTAIDDLVEQLCRQPGVHGARMTGAGFGGCVVALTEPGLTGPEGTTWWQVLPSDGARLL